MKYSFSSTSLGYYVFMQLQVTFAILLPYIFTLALYMPLTCTSVPRHILNVLHIFFVNQDYYNAFVLHCADTISTSPSKDYTTFMENSSEFVFKCSGNGKYFKWTVDGYDTGMDYVRHRGIRVSSPLLSSSDEDSVSSLLTIPTTQNNSNITVKCAMFNETHYEWSNPVKLILQGRCVSVCVCLCICIHLLLL